MYELSLSRTFTVPVERVFNAWRDPGTFQRWFGPGAVTTPEVEIDFRVGGHYRIVMLTPSNETHIVTGEYLQIVENEKLSFSWQWAQSPVRTEVDVSFRRIEGGSELHLLHRQFPDIDMRNRHTEGWNGGLDKLVSILNG